MAQKVASRVQFRPEFKTTVEIADIQQEILVYVLERVDQFDDHRGSYEAFINLLIRSCVARMCRESRRQRSRPPRGAKIESTDATIENDDGSFEEMFRSLGIDDKDRRTLGTTRDPADEFEKAEAVEHTIRTLPRGFRQIARRLKTSTQQEVAASMGISRRRMDEAMLVIRNHFGSVDLFQK